MAGEKIDPNTPDLPKGRTPLNVFGNGSSKDLPPVRKRAKSVPAKSSDPAISHIASENGKPPDDPSSSSAGEQQVSTGQTEGTVFIRVLGKIPL